MNAASGLRRLLALLGLGGGLFSFGLAAALLPPDPRILSYPALVLEPLPAPPVTLLFSDSPETPSQSGLLYRDTLSGRVRVLAYHQNGLNAPARLQLVARNPSASPLSLVRLRQGAARTSGPDPVIGQRTLLRRAVSRPRPALSLPPGGEALLYDSGPLAPGAVASLLLDLDASGPVELSVILRGPDLPRRLPPGQFPALPPDGIHQRGTFPEAERLARVELARLPARLTFGGSGDPPLSGTDALTGQPQRLAGNYGLRSQLTLVGAGGSLLAASPRGGLYQGLLTVRDGARTLSLLIGRGRALTDPRRPAALWRVRGDELELEFVPASGSNLPLALIFYPAIQQKAVSR